MNISNFVQCSIISVWIFASAFEITSQFSVLFLLCVYCELCVYARALCKKKYQTDIDANKEFQTKIHFGFSMSLQGYLISLLLSVFHAHTHIYTHTFTHVPKHIRFTLTISKIMFDLHLSKRSYMCYLKPIFTSFVQTRASHWMAEANSKWKQHPATTRQTPWSDLVMWKIEALFPSFRVFFPTCMHTCIYRKCNVLNAWFTFVTILDECIFTHTYYF